MKKYLLLLALLMPSLTYSEAGMIGFDSPVGPIGGQGHWYTLRTMRGDDFWEDPPALTDIKVENGLYSIPGEPPVSVAIVLHPNWYTDNEPWRRAIDWLRQAEQMFRNSGVPIRFIINHIETDPDMPDGKRAAFDYVDVRDYYKHEVDLVIILLPHYYGDGLCGIAQLGRVEWSVVLKSASGCSPTTLAHELGHNFGLVHDWEENKYDLETNLFGVSNRGYCESGISGDSSSCGNGTIMAYSSGRMPFFANRKYTYKGKALGDETHDAVEFLNIIKTTRSLAYELSVQQDVQTPIEHPVILD
jgi:hypothetical protein